MREGAGGLWAPLPLPGAATEDHTHGSGTDGAHDLKELSEGF